MVTSMRKHINMGGWTPPKYISGGKKNGNFIERLNREEKLFDRITVLDHPRYIQQYKSKEKQLYIDKYLQVLR